MQKTLAILLGSLAVGCNIADQARMNGMNTGEGSIGVQAPSGNGVGALLWASPIQTSDHEAHDFSLAALNDGTLLTAGYFKGSIALAEDGMSQGIALQASGRRNGFVTRHTGDGLAIDAMALGEGNDTSVFDVAPNNESGFAMAGAFTDTLDLGRAHLQSRGGFDAFVARYDANGNVQWAVPMGGTNHDTAYRLAPTINGGTWVGGNTYGNGTSGAYVALFSRGGTHPTGATITPAEGSRAALRSIASGPDGGVFAAGDFSGAMNFDSRNQVTAGTQHDAWLARYSGGGGLLWGFGLGAGTHEIVSIMAAQNGGINVLGNFRGALQLPGMHAPLESAGDSAFVAQLNRNGEATWVRVLNGTGSTSARHFAASSDGGMHITGAYTKQLILGASPDEVTSKRLGGRTATLSAVGNQDMFVASFTADGALKWAQTAGGSANDAGVRVVDHAGGAAVLVDADVTRGDMHVGTGPDEMVRIERAAGDGRHMLLMQYGASTLQ